jgi:hypothetical protein
MHVGNLVMFKQLQSGQTTKAWVAQRTSTSSRLRAYHEQRRLVSQGRMPCISIDGDWVHCTTPTALYIWKDHFGPIFSANTHNGLKPGVEQFKTSFKKRSFLAESRCWNLGCVISA